MRFNVAVYLMKILSNFHKTVETGIDPENNGEIEMLIDQKRWPNVAIATR